MTTASASFDPGDFIWDDVPAALLALLIDDLRSDHDPAPTLVTSTAIEPVSLIVLRSHGPGETAAALSEVLTLMVTLGADRLVLAAAGRIWSQDQERSSLKPLDDRREDAVIIVIAEPSGDEVAVRAVFHPFERDGEDVLLLPPLISDQGPSGPVINTLRTILQPQDRTRAVVEERDLTGQLDRLLLLGHHVSLSADAALRLTTRPLLTGPCRSVAERDLS